MWAELGISSLSNIKCSLAISVPFLINKNFNVWSKPSSALKPNNYSFNPGCKCWF